MTALTHVSLLLLAAASHTVQAKFFKTKFEDCGSILNIEDALAGSVVMTAPFNRRTGRHILGKGKQVEICINGTLPSSGLSLPFAGLKNQAHGKLEVGALTVPLPVEFCGVEYDGCRGASPACQAMGPSQPVQLCSSLTVPTESPDVDVEVTWKVLTDSNFQPTCETEFDLAALKRKGHLPLVCITIPARVQVPRG